MALIKQLDKIFELILLILIITYPIPLSKIMPFIRIPFYKFAIILLILLFISLIFILKIIRDKTFIKSIKKSLFNPQHYFLSLFIIISSIYFLRSNLSTNLLNFTEYIFISIVYLLIIIYVKNIKNIKKIFTAVVISSLVFWIIAFLQYFTNNSKIYLFGLRATGFFHGPNYFAIILIVPIIFNLALILWEKRNLLKIIYTANFFCLLLALILTFSRGAYLGLFFALAVFFYLNRKNKAIKILSIIFLLFIIIISVSKIPFGERLIYLDKDTYITKRINSCGCGFNLFLENSLFGNGIKSFSKSCSAPRDNLYLILLTEMGLIGFSLFSLFILFSIMGLITSRKKTKEYKLITAAIISCLIGILITLFFVNALQNMYLWLIFALGISLKNIRK